ncbi:hypothetical protein HFO56_23985 [Rhizobium laguerreae]|uniref:hypothetical protein n=1 Tax=Rhizobium laguerreae TaxID=1076926 RepID=UPI001C924845|nr:hypothetical protein [Rhizobium laguerreae]MBY3155389.1 hypothetical protein [Rhizobium laguerreae]
MSEGVCFALPANLTFDEIKLAVSRTFGTMVKQGFPDGDDSYCSLTLVAGNKIHDVTVSRNGEPGTPFHNLISVSVYDDPEAALDQFRELAHKLGGTFYIVNDDGEEEVLPYVEPDTNSEGYKRHMELGDFIGRDAAATLRYVAKDPEKRERLIELVAALRGDGA